MSSYVVNDSTINEVVNFLGIKANNSMFRSPRLLKEAGYDLNNREACERLAKDMFALNVQAVNERYGEDQAKQFRLLDFQYKREIFVNKIQAFKQLQCWQYQCYEGSVPDTQLFKLMDEVFKSLAVDIVIGLPEYDKEGWG